MGYRVRTFEGCIECDRVFTRDERGQFSMAFKKSSKRNPSGMAETG
jgi:hypothetical protein